MCVLFAITIMTQRPTKIINKPSGGGSGGSINKTMIKLIIIIRSRLFWNLGKQIFIKTFESLGI